MADKIINSFDVWIEAKGLKSQNQLKKIDNISLDGITKLRELILEMAVHGKLVAQDSNDETVQTLLERIIVVKDELIRKGELKRQHPLPEISVEDKPFTIPETWQFARLGDVTNYGTREQVDPDDISEDEWVLELEDVEKVTSKLLQKNYAKDRPPKSSRNRFFRGDVLYGKLRPYLDKVIVADADGVCTTEMIPLKGYDSISPEYLRLVMKSPFFVKYASASTHGMNLPRLGTDKARLAIIPIAPLNEQHRIVAKVHELMALCDELEKQETHRLKSHQLLVETLLGTLTQAKDADEFQTAWSRLAQHFDDIFTTEDSIDQLKQTILQLAVMGKLVPQDPNDEPASELLNRIEKEKQRVVKEGKVKNDKQPILVFDGKKPYELPKKWEWTTLGFVTDIIAGASFKSSDFNTSGGTKCIKITNAGVGDFLETEDYLPHSFVQKYEDYLVNEGDLILALTRPYIGEGLKISKCPPSYNKSLLNQRVAAIRSISNELDQSYAFAFLRSPNVLKHYKAKFDEKSQQPNMKMGDITNLPFPICSTKEQHRIVSKVEELFALCDQLKERIVESQKMANQMADSIIEQVA